jgi:multidrug resistance protein MdtO
VSQPDAGESLTKGIHRMLGTLIGGAAAILTVIAAGDQSWLLLPVAGIAIAFGLFVSRTCTAPYAAVIATMTFLGVQTGVALALALVDATRPTIDLLVARDRVLGVILGIGVMMLVDHAVWPVRASRSMRPALAAALRTLAGFAAMRPAPLG